MTTFAALMLLACIPTWIPRPLSSIDTEWSK